jgi:cytidine deaminase
MPELKQVPIDEAVAKEMLLRAEAAKVNTYPDPGGYAVCVLTDRGNMYEGVSYKSTTLTLTMHSEATALANAAIHGEKNIVAITGPNCHICKQLLWESSLQSGIEIQVIIPEGDSVKFVPISDLMPYPWPDKDGNK